MITTICYGEKKEWKNKDNALKHFFECMMCSEGSEHERYSHIVADIMCGNKVCTDGVD